MKTGRPRIHGDEYLGGDGRWWVRTPTGRKRRAVAVMEKIIGKLIPKGFHVHHRDGNCTNDLPDNLELLSASKHSQKQKGIKNKRKGHPGEDHPRAKLTWKNVRLIRKLYDTRNYSQSKLAKQFNVHQTMVGKIVGGKAWQKT